MANRRNYSTELKGDGYWSTDSHPDWVPVRVEQSRYAYRTASDYSRRKPAGLWLTPTSYSMKEEKGRRAEGSFQNQLLPPYPPYYNYESGVLPFHQPVGNYVNEDSAALGFPLSIPSDLTNRALTKARLKIKDGSIDLGVAYGERRETAKFVGDALGDIARIIRAIRRRNWRRVSDILDDYAVDLANPRKAGEKLLQWQYAVKPLCQDIYGVVDAFDRAFGDGQSWKMTVKASTDFKFECENRPCGVFSTRDYRSSSYKVLHGSFVRIDCTPGNSALRTAASLGLTNPVNTAWELVPLSFVVDWALPLGDYFSQFDALVGWDVLGCSVSNLSKIEAKYHGLNAEGFGYKNTANWTAEYRKVELTRSGGVEVPFATFPNVKDPFSKLHVASGLALLQQAVAAWGRS